MDFRLQAHDLTFTYFMSVLRSDALLSSSLRLWLATRSLGNGGMNRERGKLSSTTRRSSLAMATTTIEIEEEDVDRHDTRAFSRPSPTSNCSKNNAAIVKEKEDGKQS